MATLIRDGMIFDGSGRPGRRADVLVEDGRVRRMGYRLPVPDGAEVIDAHGCWVMPGFIDLHTHYDAELEFAPALLESVRHGVTTTLVGSCGLSFAVGTPEDLADMFCRVEGIPRAEVLPLLERVLDWQTPAEYLKHLDGLPLGPNVTSLLGHSALRAHVMGLGRSLDRDVQPTRGELHRMTAMIEDALDHGYLGLSINTLPWDKMDGTRYRSRPTPSVFARWPEYRALTKPIRRRNALFEAVPDLSTRVNLLLFAAMSSGITRARLRTMLISMVDIKALRGTHRLTGAYARLTRRLLRGDVRFQSLPMPFEIWTDGLENPVIEEFGAGAQALHLPADGRAELMRDPAYRAAFRKQWTNKLAGRAYHRDLREARIVDCPDGALIGKSFAEVAKERGADPIDAFLDLQAEYGNALRWYSVIGSDRPDELAWIVNHPDVLIGFSDAGAHLRNMAFYNFPLRLLKLVRDREAAGLPVMSLPRAVYRLTGELADYLGIEAGHLVEGERADVVIVDPQGLGAAAEEIHEAPMPGFPGLERMVRRNDDAVRAVMINGRIAWNGDKKADELGVEAGFGTVLRGAY